MNFLIKSAIRSYGKSKRIWNLFSRNFKLLHIKYYKQFSSKNNEDSAGNLELSNEKINEILINSENLDNYSLSYSLDDVKGTSGGSEIGQYYLMFTCNVCNGKYARKFTKQAYHHGVVLIKCEGCKSLHLIADNLGWFSESPSNLDTLTKESGHKMIKVSEENIQKLVEEFQARTKMNEDQKFQQVDLNEANTQKVKSNEESSKEKSNDGHK